MTDPLPATATYYSYDIHGNVDTLVQDYGGVASAQTIMYRAGQRFKRMVYDYDLISGKVNAVAYQPGRPDAYYTATATMRRTGLRKCIRAATR